MMYIHMYMYRGNARDSNSYLNGNKLNVNNDHALCNRLEFFEQFYNYVYQNTSRYSFEQVSAYISLS